MDIKIDCKHVEIEKSYGQSISVKLSDIDKGDLDDTDVYKIISLEAFIDTIGAENILSFMGDTFIIDYLESKSYKIV